MGRSGYRNDKDRFLAVLKINIAVFIAELMAGWHSGSLSMASDSFHVSLHIVASLVALASEFQFMGLSSDKVKQWSAWINIFLFFPLAASISYEAYQRLINPPVVSITPIFFTIAFLGLIANIYTIKILDNESDEEHSGNENKFLLQMHMVFDALGSVIVIVGGAVIGSLNLYWLDPVASFALAGLIVIGAIAMSWKLFHGHGHIH